MTVQQLKITANGGNNYQEIRLSIASGGPDSAELVLSVTDDYTKLAIWNPFTNSWHSIYIPSGLDGLGGLDRIK